jgi:hypothetical protein
MTFGVGLSRLPNVFGINVDGTKERRSPRSRWLIGIAALGVGLSGCFLLFTQVGTHITDCGFDADGSYAKVRANRLLGVQEVWVDFSLDGKQYAYAGAYNVRGTTVLRVPFPREEEDGFHVSGRTVYVDTTHHKHNPDHIRYVTRKFSEAHPHTTGTEVVPDSSHTLSCRFDYTDPD